MSQARPRMTPPRDLPSPTMVLYALLLALTMGLVSWTALELTDPAALPIRRIMVEGEFLHLDPRHVQSVVGGAVDAGFFGVDVAELRALLQDQPWIRDAAIRRVWPDGLHVSIVEQTPAARWGDYGLLNDAADIFVPDPEDLPEGLVRLSGPLGSEAEVLECYRYVRGQLGRIGLSAMAVELSDRHAWTVTTNGGHEIVFGRKDFENRLARFVFGYSRALEHAWSQIGRVDLRYTNGFAVGARAPAERSG